MLYGSDGHMPLEGLTTLVSDEMGWTGSLVANVFVQVMIVGVFGELSFPAVAPGVVDFTRSLRV
jgi:hypothetical protein